MIVFAIIHDIHGVSSCFNDHLQHISGIYGIPVCKGCTKTKHIVNLMREIRFYCGKLRWTLIMTLFSWAFRRSIYYHVFFCIRCMRLFQTHLGLSWTRYDVISVSAARLLVAAVGCSCCKVHGNSRGESVDRPPQLIPATHLLRICGCQQNMSATVVVGKSSHVFLGHRK